MIYESEVLFKLMERDGFNIPSSVPPYESEIKAYLIEQVKNAYPKLTDYEAEWLLYNYTKHLPADFPISSVTNVTNASFENVVPFAYQSAILKGQTLVNLVNYSNFNKSFYSYDDYGVITVKGGDSRAWSNVESISYYYKPSTTYTFIIYNKVNISNITIDASKKTSDDIFTYKTGADTTSIYLKVKINRNDSSIVGSLKMMILEGDYTNTDIPYFTGMQSAKMPVLTTTGKNLFNINGEFNTVGATYSINGDSLTITGDWFVRQVVDLKPNTIYTLSYEKAESDSGYTRIAVYTDEVSYGIASTDANKLTFTTPASFKDISVIFYVEKGENINTVTYTNIQLEEGSTATSCEPYKSNILTVNEPIELRGIGDVKDELNLLTGELTQRIGEVVLDGSEDEIYTIINQSSGTHTSFIVRHLAGLIKTIGENNTGDLLSDKIQSEPHSIYNQAVEGIHNKNNNLYINLSNEKTGGTVDGLKAYLQSNPIKVQYLLTTESVKTVDLKTINENGESVYFMPLEGTMHISCNSQTIPPTFDMSVPVEATTQNLASFIDLEMEE